MKIALERKQADESIIPHDNDDDDNNKNVIHAPDPGPYYVKQWSARMAPSGQVMIL